MPRLGAATGDLSIQPAKKGLRACVSKMVLKVMVQAAASSTLSARDQAGMLSLHLYIMQTCKYGEGMVDPLDHTFFIALNFKATKYESQQIKNRCCRHQFELFRFVVDAA